MGYGRLRHLNYEMIDMNFTLKQFLASMQNKTSVSISTVSGNEHGIYSVKDIPEKYLGISVTSYTESPSMTYVTIDI